MCFKYTYEGKINGEVMMQYVLYANAILKLETTY